MHQSVVAKFECVSAASTVVSLVPVVFALL